MSDRVETAGIWPFRVLGIISDHAVVTQMSSDGCIKAFQTDARREDALATIKVSTAQC